jgi:hypothetical protein
LVSALRKARLGVLALGLTAAACYPEFSFLDSGNGGSGGTGNGSTTARVSVGAGGAEPSTTETSTTITGHMTTATTTTGPTSSSSSTGMPVVPQVSCGPPELTINGWELDPCSPGDVCCFDKSTPLGDYCTTPPMNNDPACPTSTHYAFACDGPQDCEPGLDCCANVSGSSVVATTCAQGCVAPNIVLCETTADCGGAGTCQIVFSDDGYDIAYLGCE